MDFKDAILSLAQRVNNTKESVKTEEATKMAFIMPFIQSLGYDVFNPEEVEPECVCDIFKKGEKVDYAIHNEGVQSLLIECKDWHENLDKHGDQLRRYYNVSNAKFGLLTNGIEYRFYTDLDNANVLDEKPFLQFVITDITDNQIEEVKRFHKSYYKQDEVLASASDLKYLSEIKSVLVSSLEEPSAEFVKLILNGFYAGLKTPKVIERFTPLVKKTFVNYINDTINDRLSKVLATTVAQAREEEQQKFAIPTASNSAHISEDCRVITTKEEIEGFQVVKAILRKVVPVSRIAYRDAIGYFAILLDDNNRKTLARLYFNTANKYLSFFDADKKEVKVPISSIDDIYNYSQQLEDAAERLESEKD